MPGNHIGQRYSGLTSRRLVAGRGAYVGDLRLDGMLHVAVLRSPHPHAWIRAVDPTAAEALPGVVYVVTGAEIRVHTQPIPSGWDTSAVGARSVDWYALCTDRARYVGEAVAAVVAEDPYTAHRALDHIEVDYELADAVCDPIAALDPGAPLVEPDWGSNLVVSRDLRSGDLEAGRRAGVGSVHGTLTVNRTTGVPLEPRGIVASYDRDEEVLTFWESTQNPHPLRVYLAQTLGLTESRIRVIQPHVGGAFGLKQPTFQEEPLLGYLALQLGRPVRWIEQRSENFLATGHARDMRVTYDASYDADGVVTALEMDIVADVGAPTALVGWGMSFSASGLVPGAYRIPNTHVRLSTVATNKCPWNSYRGFGKDAANWWLERVMDHVARDTGITRADVRLRNLISADEFPFAREGGGIIDSGDYSKALRTALDLVGDDDFAAEREAARRDGRLIGLGLGHELSPEGCGMPGSVMISSYDGATVRVSPTGDVTVLSGVTSPGNGNETALAQIAAETLGTRMDAVRVLQGDTLTCPWGLGNYSSRGIIIGGSAVEAAATDLRDKLLHVAGNMLEANPEDLTAEDGRISVRGAAQRFVDITDVAAEIYKRPFGPHADSVEPGLEATRYWRAPNVFHQPAKQGRFSAYPTWPSAASACVVEVDAETGMVHILRYVLVDDAGNVINPQLVEANLHGATAQAIGGALYEQIAYSSEGQPLSATLMDYTIPTAVEMPFVEVSHQHSPSPFTPLGTKGAGESGMGCALAALTSAVEDALRPLEVCLDELPLTPARVRRAITRAERTPEQAAH